jgi:hypothetical protein
MFNRNKGCVSEGFDADQDPDPISIFLPIHIRILQYVTSSCTQIGKSEIFFYFCSHQCQFTLFYLPHQCHRQCCGSGARSRSVGSLCLGPLGFGSRTINTSYGSGSFYHQAKICKMMQIRPDPGLNTNPQH